MFRIFVILSFLISFSAFSKGAATVYVDLSPAGSFEIESKKVKGKAVRKGDMLVANKVKLKASSLSSGLKLRDDHIKNKYLQVDKFKYIEILEGKGKGGKGTAVIQVKDIKKKVGFSYTEKGGNMVISFPLSLKDFNFTGISYAGVGVKDKVRVKAVLPIK